MHSKVAEETRRRQAEREAALSLEERAARLESANEFAIVLYARMHGIGRDEAREQIERAGASGRDESTCAKRTANP